MPVLRLSIRAKVLMASAVLLVIPYVGYRYVQETENFLREGLEASVLGAAQALAGALHDRVDLLRDYADASRDAADEIFVSPLAHAVQVDGYGSDWDDYRENLKTLAGGGAPGALSARYLAGQHADYVYLLIEVDDSDLRYRTPAYPRAKPGDWVDIQSGDRPDAPTRYRLSPISPGQVNVYVVDKARPDATLDRHEPRIRAHWQPRRGGYAVEVRLPLTLTRRYLGIEVADVDPATGQVSARVSTANAGAGPGRLVFPSSGILGVIRSLGRTPGRRIRVVDPRGRVLASGGTLATRAPPADIHPLFALILGPPPADLFERPSVAGELSGAEVNSALAGEAATRWKSTADPDVFVVSAAYPVWIADRVAGAVVVEETSLGIQTVRRKALADLFTNTLLAFGGAGLLLFLFANRISRRLGRLRDEAENAFDEHGRVVGEVSPSRAGDEIGDLSRSFSGLTRRLKQYNRYLEQLARRLSHELRTPLAVIRSSLDTLGLSERDPDAEKYLARAREGLSRLDTIIVRMSEATRLEEVLKGAERERFDLNAMLAASIEGYRQTWPETSMRYLGPAEPVVIDGVPDLVAQLLDKLISNARDFAAPESNIYVRLLKEDARPVLEVVNDGPPLPDAMAGKLFESMVSVRHDGRQEKPHLGLGLYIVRLIAEFHGAAVSAANRADGKGVTVQVRFPAPTR